MSKRYTVQLDADRFDRLARPTVPQAGVAELVWNALDAEAEVVTVSIARTEFDAVEYVLVSDDGHGMTNEEVVRDFRRLGGSWKKVGTQARRLSKNGLRSLHGCEGEGRFRAFALGRTAEWTTVAKNDDGQLERTVVTGSLDSSEFVISDPEPLATGSPNTVVRLTEPREFVGRLLGAHALPWLIARFAVYLIRYPNVAVIFDGARLDPASILDRQTEIDLDLGLTAEHGPATLRILEWKPEAATIKPSLLLCDDNGVGLHEIENITTAGGIRFTAYVTWAGFSALANDLLLADSGHAVLGPVVEAARQAVGRHLDSRLSEQHQETLDRWKVQRVYPYTAPTTSRVEEQERRFFDAVALAAAPRVATEPRAAKLTLGLIKEALSQPPGALHRVLKEVLDLTPEQVAEFDALLERTTLASVIHTSRLVTNRLDFLRGLEEMLFDADSKRRLLERKQLHRILANGRTWVFGEDFSLAVDDKGLTAVLEAHRHLVGDGTPVTAPVRDTAGHTRIIDLMLSKASFGADRRHHLVVELKRPKVVLTQAELAQITNYAIAVVRDERFHSPNVTWDFWLVGDDIDPVVDELSHKPGQPEGLYTPGRRYNIWVRRWAEVLEENRQRLHFYRDHLDHEPPEDVGLDETLGKYLPNLTEPGQADAPL